MVNWNSWAAVSQCLPGRPCKSMTTADLLKGSHLVENLHVLPSGLHTGIFKLLKVAGGGILGIAQVCRLSLDEAGPPLDMAVALR